MSDAEMLELAAKAAGIKVWRGQRHQSDMLFREVEPNDGKVTGVEWNPLTDDGDALRLAVRLDIHVGPNPGNGKAIAYSVEHIAEETYGADKFSATRRAIVMAAAGGGEQTCRT